MPVSSIHYARSVCHYDVTLKMSSANDLSYNKHDFKLSYDKVYDKFDSKLCYDKVYDKVDFKLSYDMAYE